MKLAGTFRIRSWYVYCPMILTIYLPHPTDYCKSVENTGLSSYNDVTKKGGGPVQVEIKIDGSCIDPKVIIMTAAMTKDVQDIIQKLSDDRPQIISGSQNGKIKVLEPADLIRIYANAGKVCAATDKGEYALRLRLYEAEERLDARQFVRISHSEIINLKKVNHFDLSFTGTICVKLSDGSTAYVSRRYVSKIKKILGV